MRKGRTYLKANDQVEVIAGKDKGRVGKVLKVFPDTSKATVERINMIKRHTKPREMNQQGQIVEREAPIHVSNLQLICPECTLDRSNRQKDSRRWDEGTLLQEMR